MTASINRLSCDKYTGTNITQPLLPMERGGLSFINTWGRRSHAEWLEWANNTHPDNEGDVLIQALLQLPLDFTQRLCMRVFGFCAPHDHYRGPSHLNRAALEILAACAWGEGGHTVVFDADRNHFNYPTGLQGRSARPTKKASAHWSGGLTATMRLAAVQNVSATALWSWCAEDAEGSFQEGRCGPQ